MTAATRDPTRYAEVERGCDIDLSDNTNLWGAPPSVAATLRSPQLTDLSRYPSAYSGELKRSLARYAGVDDSMIVTGCGSDDVLDSAIRAFGVSGDAIAMQDPGFSMIPVFAAVSGLATKWCDRKCPGLVNEMSSANPRIVYLCSPNNPTGEVLSLETIEAIVSGASGLVIVDEAYIEFGGESSVKLIERFDNLLITRTFSKALGLAGFRLGYGITSASIAQRVEAARGPYKVSAPAERAGASVLENDMQWVADKTIEAVTNRECLSTEIRVMGLKPLDSKANFLLIPVADSRLIESRLRERSVAVRAFEGLTGIGDALRVTIGPWPMMQRFIDALHWAVR